MPVSHRLSPVSPICYAACWMLIWCFPSTCCAAGTLVWVAESLCRLFKHLIFLTKLYVTTTLSGKGSQLKKQKGCLAVKSPVLSWVTGLLLEKIWLLLQGKKKSCLAPVVKFSKIMYFMKKKNASTVNFHWKPFMWHLNTQGWVPFLLLNYAVWVNYKQLKFSN